MTTTENAVERIRRAGRMGDSRLVHMSAAEVQAMHDASPMGLTINPDTGLPEAYLLTPADFGPPPQAAEVLYPQILNYPPPIAPVASAPYDAAYQYWLLAQKKKQAAQKEREERDRRDEDNLPTLEERAASLTATDKEIKEWLAAYDEGSYGKSFKEGAKRTGYGIVPALLGGVWGAATRGLAGPKADLYRQAEKYRANVDEMNRWALDSSETPSQFFPAEAQSLEARRSDAETRAAGDLWSGGSRWGVGGTDFSGTTPGAGYLGALPVRAPETKLTASPTRQTGPGFLMAGVTPHEWGAYTREIHPDENIRREQIAPRIQPVGFEPFNPHFEDGTAWGAYTREIHPDENIRFEEQQQREQRARTVQEAWQDYPPADEPDKSPPTGGGGWRGGPDAGVGWALGGQIPAPRQDTPAVQDNPIVEGAIAAIQGRHPEPEQAIKAFVGTYGQQAFAQLREQVLAGERQSAGLGSDLITGPGDGLSDDVPAIIEGPGGREEPVKLSPGEVVVDANVVSGLGNGSTEAGAGVLDEMGERVRQARLPRTGDSRPRAIDPRRMLPA